MKSLYLSALVLTLCSSESLGQNRFQPPPTRLPSRPNIALNAGLNRAALKQASSSKGLAIRLSQDAIFITIADDDLPFKIDCLDKSMDAGGITKFLTAFYDGSKAQRTNDIVVRSTTKRLVDGENELVKTLESIRKKHKVNVVLLPLPTGINPHAEIENFARNFFQ